MEELEKLLYVQNTCKERIITKKAFTCSKSTIETPEKM